MNEAVRQGWCPGALRPMMARDGLLVRLRISAGHLDADRASALAALSAFYGNGLMDLSARANLQLRGVADDGLAPLLDALDDLGLLDDDPAGEAVRNVMASPLAGLPGRFDIRAIVQALEQRLVEDASLHALPGKFGFLIDDGGEVGVASESADVRFDFTADGRVAWIGLGGTRDSAVSLGFCAPERIVETAAAVARIFLPLAAAQEPPVRRMADLVRRLGLYQAARAFGAPAETTRPGYAAAILHRVPAGLFAAGPTSVFGLAMAFGRLDHEMLRFAAALADEHADGVLRLTPWRCLLVPGLRSPVDLQACRAAGFIVDPGDASLRIAACVGRDGCARGTTSTHADAALLAGTAARLGGGPISIHVSGCEKGCAKASRTAFTLVGRAGRYDLVQGGRAADPPTRRDLDLAGVREALLAAKVPA